MSYKLKHNSINVFSKEISAKICDEFFNQNKKIDGNQLMCITGSSQTNLLLVKILFEKWRFEMTKLESPYFDFEKDEVKIALDSFMKALSKHILIERTDFEPILSEALSASVVLHFEPVNFYQDHLLAAFGEKVNSQELIDLKKYLKFNSAPFSKAIARIENDEVSIGELRKLIESSFENFELEVINAEEFLEELNAKNSMDLLFVKEAEKTKPIVEEINEELAPSKPKAKKVKLIADEDENVPALNDKFEKSKKTLVDKLNQKAKKDIESGLNLNEKIMFIKNLFEGNKAAFKVALEDLENSSDLSDAISKVQAQYGGDWDMKGEAAEAFIEVLERRFA